MLHFFGGENDFISLNGSSDSHSLLMKHLESKLMKMKIPHSKRWFSCWSPICDTQYRITNTTHSLQQNMIPTNSCLPVMNVLSTCLHCYCKQTKFEIGSYSARQDFSDTNDWRRSTEYSKLPSILTKKCI